MRAWKHETLDAEEVVVRELHTAATPEMAPHSDGVCELLEVEDVV